MLLPLLLDLFLWLGPHLSIYPLTVKFSNLIDEELPLSAAAAETRRALTESLEQAGEQLNVFAFVSTAPIGIPSLIAGKAPMDAPIGEPTVWAVTGELQLLTFALGFTLIGLLLGAVYFSFIARGVVPGATRWNVRQAARRIWISWARMVAFVVLMFVVLTALSVPLLLLVGLAGLLSATLANIVVSLGFAAVLWLLLYVGFAVHGIVLKNRGVLAAIWDSIRLVQWNLPGVVGLFSLIMIISWGLGYLWNIPSGDTWLLLAGILGHAFVATGLITATFVFYQDRYRWWNELREYRRQILALEHERRERRRS